MGVNHTCIFYVDDIHLYTEASILLKIIAERPKTKAFFCLPDRISSMISNVMGISSNASAFTPYEYSKWYSLRTFTHLNTVATEYFEQIKSVGYDELVIIGDADNICKQVPIETVKDVESIIDDAFQGLPIYFVCFYPFHSPALNRVGLTCHHHFNSDLNHSWFHRNSSIEV